MKKRRKTRHCLNCGCKLTPSFEFCPNCGQENTDNQVSFQELLKDFLANYFSLDSGFGRSYKPFFFKPGFLTKEFMEGKRVKYANPVRLYLVITLIHFFVLSLYTAQDPETKGIIKKVETDERRTPPDTTNVLAHEDGSQTDTISSESAKRRSTDTWPISNDEWRLIRQMTANNDYSVEAIADSLKIDKKPFIERLLIRQMIKVVKADIASFNEYQLKNIPILMFFLLPVYALILKLFLRKWLYINHIVHSIHIHSFTFLLLTIYWILGLIIRDVPPIGDVIVFLVLLVYLIASFKNAYSLSKWKATTKVLLTGMIYSIAMIFAFFLQIIISILTF